MKKIRYLVFGLLLGCFGLTSFTSACNNYFGNLLFEDFYGFSRASGHVSPGNYCLPTYDGYFCFQSSSAGTLTTPKGGNYTIPTISDIETCIFLDNSNGGYEYTNSSYFNFSLSVPSNSSSCDYSQYESIISSLSGQLHQCNVGYNSCSDQVEFCDGLFRSCQSDLTACQNSSNGLSCSNTGTVSDLTNRVLLYTGSVSLNSSSYTNIFNYGNNGAGTYCVKLTSSSPQTLSFGFANGGTTAPTNLYSLYNDQYNNYVCLYGNKSYFNAKLNSSSNTVSYEVYKLTDLYNEDICINNEIVGNDCNTCESSLGACLEDNLSLENMNESLSSQLEACLLNGGNGCDPEIDTGCITGAFQVPLLSWSVGLDSFTTPIINNLTLPTNYKGKIVDGVLTISSVNNNLSISDSDMEEIKNSIVEVSQYIFRLALILMIIYYIKFYIFNSKK